jgi:hypothetical protein
MATSQSLDTNQSNPASRLLLQILASVAEFECEMIRERTLMDVRAAQAKGKIVGRPKRILQRDEVVRLRDESGKSWNPILHSWIVEAEARLSSVEDWALLDMMRAEPRLAPVQFYDRQRQVIKLVGWKWKRARSRHALKRSVLPKQKGRTRDRSALTSRQDIKRRTIVECGIGT